MPLQAHYAISEALIVLAAIVSGWFLFKRGERLIVAAFALFALPALIGATRYGAGLHEMLADSHQMTSEVGGLVGILLMLLALVQRIGVSVPAWGGALLVVGVVGLAALLPVIGLLVTLAAFVIAVAILVVPKNTLMQRVTTLLAFGAIMMVGTGFLATTGFNAATRWHIYHVVAALWIELLPYCLSRPQRAA